MIMKRLFTKDDIIDLYSKIKLRGIHFILSKFNLNNTKRTKSAFNELNINAANSWIIPAIHSNFSTICEKPFGGNILIPVLKDIAHHFVDLNEEKRRVLKNLFEFEDNFLKSMIVIIFLGFIKNMMTYK